MQFKVNVADGKYSVVFDNGELHALRFEAPWRDLCGDNLVYYLAYELMEAREEVETLKQQVKSLERY